MSPSTRTTDRLTPTTVWKDPSTIADELGVHYRTVLNWIADKRLKAAALGDNGTKPYRSARTGSTSS